MDRVELYIDRYPVTNIRTYQIRYDMFGGAGSFTAAIDPDYHILLCGSNNPEQAGPGQGVQFNWVINGVPWMRGWIDKVERTYSKTGVELTISGRDHMQVLTDNHIMVKTDPYSLPLDQIVLDVWAQNSIIHQMSDNNGSTDIIIPFDPPLQLPPTQWQITTSAQQIATTTRYESIIPNYGQSLFDFIGNLINQVGLFMYNIPGSNIILIHHAAAPNTNPDSYAPNGTLAWDGPYRILNQTNANNQNPNNVLGCNFSQDIVDYHKFFRVIGQSSRNKTLSTGEVLEEALNLYVDKLESDSVNAGYRGLMKFKTVEVNHVDALTWSNSGLKQRFVSNALLQMNRKLFNIKYTLQGHSATPGGYPYFFNHMADVTDDFVGLNSAPFLVYGVEFTGDRSNGPRTILELALPSSTNSDIEQQIFNSVQPPL